jgi:hypothetical protein
MIIQTLISIIVYPIKDLLPNLPQCSTQDFLNVAGTPPMGYLQMGRRYPSHGPSPIRNGSYPQCSLCFPLARVAQQAGNFDLIEPVMHVHRRRQIPHGGFERPVTHPVLNRPDIESGPEHARRIG